MTSQRGNPKVTSWHLAGKAAIYVRQSTLEQVEHNVGSRAVQESLYDLALEYGWAADRIHVLRDDLGKSATSIGKRSDFQRLLDMIRAGDVRAVFAQNMSRLSRNALDGLRLFEALRRAKALLYYDGRFVDMGNESANDRFVNTQFAALAQLDSDNRIHQMGEARVKTARGGLAVTRAPIGYVKASRGKWAKDSDTDVQRIITLVFELALKLRSLDEMVKHLRAHNFKFPRRVKGQLQWEPVTRNRLYDVVTNPQYTGDFVYGRTKISRDLEAESRTVTPRPPDEWLRCPDHHDAYISREDWQVIQDRLAARSPRVRPVVGRGNALVQGRVRCGICHEPMKTQYSQREAGVRTGSYICAQKDRHGRTTHRLTCSARLVDRAVEQEVLKALTPAEMQVALDSIAEALLEHKTTQRSLQRQLRDAEDEAEARYRDYRTADPNPNYARARNALMEKWEQALAEKERLERQVAADSRSPQPSLSTADAQELVQRTADAGTLWRHPATTHADRKDLLGTLISEIIVRASTKETIDLEIGWIGGMRQPLRVLRPRDVHALIKDAFQAGKQPTTIARELREAGFMTAKGHPMTRLAVYTSLRVQGLLPANGRNTTSAGTPRAHVSGAAS